MTSPGRLDLGLVLEIESIQYPMLLGREYNKEGEAQDSRQKNEKLTRNSRDPGNAISSTGEIGFRGNRDSSLCVFPGTGEEETKARSSSDPASLRCRTQLGSPGAYGRVRCLLCWFCILKGGQDLPACSGEHIPAISSCLFSLACTVM